MKSVFVLGAAALMATFHPLMAAPIPVRFAEGVTHGFLVLSGVDGVTVAHGDLFQVVRGEEIDKRMIFRFKDGSVLDENVTFTQRGVYALKSYRLSEKGPAFEQDREISMTPANGAYRVKMKDHKGGAEKSLEGTLDLPADVYNGLILTVVKNFRKGAGEIVHFVAFTPTPRLIELALTPAGEEKVTVGDITTSAVHYVMKPRLGVWLKIGAKITGRMPADLHAWVATDEVPAFVEFEGAMGTQGQIWRIETVSPRRPRQ
jgi:hypothetical protein